MSKTYKDYTRFYGDVLKNLKAQALYDADVQSNSWLEYDFNHQQGEAS